MLCIHIIYGVYSHLQGEYIGDLCVDSVISVIFHHILSLPSVPSFSVTSVTYNFLIFTYTYTCIFLRISICDLSTICPVLIHTQSRIPTQGRDAHSTWCPRYQISGTIQYTVGVQFLLKKKSRQSCLYCIQYFGTTGSTVQGIATYHQPT